MAIYLDAEPLFDMSPNSLALSSLRIIAREHALEIAIPEVALSEAVAKRREHIESKISAIETAIEKARGFFDAPQFRRPNVDELIGSYRRELVSGMRIIPVAGDHAMEALSREINRTPPAREGFGARDAAIWLAIRDDHLSRSERGYFVSGNRRDFGEADDQLKSELRAEVVRGQSFTYVQEISALLPLLAQPGGQEFTIEELESGQALRWMMRNRLNDLAAQPDNLNSLVQMAYGAPLRWSGISSSVREPALFKIPHQNVYRLPTGQEVGVLRTSWAAFVDLTLSGPRQLVDAGFNKGLGAFVAHVELWARRNPDTLETEFSLSGRDKFEVASIPSLPTMSDESSGHAQ
jgi:hypothetical protein